jgi:hypothetical protein
VPVRIGIGAARAVAVSQTPPGPIASRTPESAVPGASSGDRVASGSGGLPIGVVILLALILICAAGLGVRHWDRRRKQAAGQESRSIAPMGRAYDGASGGQTARRRRLGVRRLLPSRTRTQAARPTRGYSESVTEMFASPELRAAMASERTKLRRRSLPWRSLARLWDRDSQRQF